MKYSLFKLIHSLFDFVQHSHTWFQFIVEREIAISGSETIKAMLDGGFREAEEGLVRFPDIQGMILEKVVKYLLYKFKHSKSTGKLPEFDIEPEIALELLVAANYLNC